jgi:hypothetical protein
MRELLFAREMSRDDFVRRHAYAFLVTEISREMLERSAA